jgi:hypothetical protein
MQAGKEVAGVGLHGGNGTSKHQFSGLLVARFAPQSFQACVGIGGILYAYDKCSLADERLGGNCLTALQYDRWNSSQTYMLGGWHQYNKILLYCAGGYNCCMSASGASSP